MRFLVENYSNHNNTESYYINEVLNHIDGCKSYLWDSRSTSSYDMFDMTKPNFFITHIANLSKDTIIYLSENKHISLVMNLSGCTEQYFNNIQTILKSNEVKCPLSFVNYANYSYQSDFINIATIYHGADVFLGDGKNVQYKINNAIILNTKNKLPYNEEESCHYISLDSNLQDVVDFVAPVMQLSNVYKNYDIIHFEGFNNVIPQVFFDAIYYGNNISYPKDNKLFEEICRLLRIESLSDITKLKRIVKEKHTCFNRVKSILSQLPCSEQVSKLTKVMEQINL